MASVTSWINRLTVHACCKLTAGPVELGVLIITVRKHASRSLTLSSFSASNHSNSNQVLSVVARQRVLLVSIAKAISTAVLESALGAVGTTVLALHGVGVADVVVSVVFAAIQAHAEGVETLGIVLIELAPSLVFKPEQIVVRLA